MSIIDRDALQASPLADLHAIASELSIDGYRRLRKQQLIDAILARQEGTEAPEAEAESERRARGHRADAAEASAEAKAAEERRGAGAPPRIRGHSRTSSPGRRETDSESEAEELRRGRGSRRGDRRRARRARRRVRAAGAGAADGAAVAAAARAMRIATSERDEEPEEPRRPRSPRQRPEPEEDEAEESRGGPAEDETVDGVVELVGNGSGFVRANPPEPSDDDVYVSAAQVKRCELLSGDRITGPRRPPRRSERFASLVRIDTINGRPASEVADSTRFDDLPSAFAQEMLPLRTDDATVTAIEGLAPDRQGLAGDDRRRRAVGQDRDAAPAGRRARRQRRPARAAGADRHPARGAVGMGGRAGQARGLAELRRLGRRPGPAGRAGRRPGPPVGRPRFRRGRPDRLARRPAPATPRARCWPAPATWSTADR